MCYLISLMEIVVATRNRKKLREISRILEGLDVELLTMDDFPDCPEVEETESTFEGNAVKKAITVSSCTGRSALADDSGLEVDALEGAPGIYSARYAGEGATDKDNVEKLISEMDAVSEEKRSARFVCVIALAWPNGQVETFSGQVEGRIGMSPSGSSGFGYDPLFYPEGRRRTFAQMPPADKDAMSHRGRALMRLRDYLKTLK
jgi:XTP/dITP diphosphohydrolase